MLPGRATESASERYRLSRAVIWISTGHPERPTPAAFLQGALEVEAPVFTPLALIDPGRARALLTRVEVKLNSALGASKLGEPCEKGGAVPAATSFRKRDEVV